MLCNNPFCIMAMKPVNLDKCYDVSRHYLQRQGVIEAWRCEHCGQTRMTKMNNGVRENYSEVIFIQCEKELGA